MGSTDQCGPFSPFDIHIHPSHPVILSGNDFLPIAYARSAPYSGSFLMVGGYSKGDYLDTVYYYEPESDSFRLLESRLEGVKEASVLHKTLCMCVC